MKLGVQVGLIPGHIVLDGDLAHLPAKGGRAPRLGAEPPRFSAHICCGEMAGWIKMPLGMEVRLGQGDFVLDGDPAPLHKKGAEPPKFSAHIYCGQTAGWIKMVLGMEVGISPGDFVLVGDLAPSTIFGPFLLSLNGWMHQDIKMPLGMAVGFSPGDFVFDGTQLLLPK